MNTVKFNRMEKCKNWMRAFVQPPRKPAAEVIKAGKSEGYSDSELHLAKKALKIKSIKQTARGPWFWYLPEHLGKKTVNVVNSQSPNAQDIGEFPVNNRTFVANSSAPTTYNNNRPDSATVNCNIRDNNNNFNWWAGIGVIMAGAVGLFVWLATAGKIKLK